ncbi:MAG: DUF1467 family protein [Caulobacteraceae bacterium]
MDLATSISAYLLIWWVTLFAVLPIGNRSYAEEGLEVPGGGDPAAPVEPRLKKKFLTTTWVAVIPFALLWLTVHFHLVSLPHF